MEVDANEKVVVYWRETSDGGAAAHVSVSVKGCLGQPGELVPKVVCSRRSFVGRAWCGGPRGRCIHRGCGGQR